MTLSIKKSSLIITLMITAILNTSCTTIKNKKLPPDIEKKSDTINFFPLRLPSADTKEEQALLQNDKNAIKEKESKMRFYPTPKVPFYHEKMASYTNKKPSIGKKITVNFEAMALPAFINEIYGNIMGITFEIDSSLNNKQDLVTLRTENTITMEDLDSLSRQVLSHYGIKVVDEGKIKRFVPGTGSSYAEPPLMVSGRTLPDVPNSHRLIFQLIPLVTVKNINIAGWLKTVFEGYDLKIFEDMERNAVLLMGTPEIIKQALEVVHTLDQPYMRGRHSLRIEPIFLSAAELSGLLVDVLNSEGYAASLKGALGSIIVLPINTINVILVFASDTTVIDHIKSWAEILDRSNKQGEKPNFFSYEVRNTRASNIVSVLEKMSATGQQVSPQVQTDPQKVKEENKSKGNIVVDEERNNIIFWGDAESWKKMLMLIKAMDKPTLMVLIEVVVAEITLDNQNGTGIKWLLNKTNPAGTSLELGTWKGLQVGASGLSFALDNAGNTRAMLNVFANENRIKILSNPRIMVNSGGDASIDVGTEVPIITSQSSTPEVQTQGTSAILQTIQYRKTGVLLKVKPIVYSGTHIDLDITQEVSESQPNTSSNVSSPMIFSRKISTKMGLTDGGSVLLGGLISSNKTKNVQDIPVLGKIPFLGKLFRSDQNHEARTELVMLIIPYIVNNHKDAVSITEEIKKQLNFKF